MRTARRARLVALFLFGALCSTLPGCAVLGRQQKDHRIDPQALSKIKKGMSKEEVTNLLGAPQDIIFSNMRTLGIDRKRFDQLLNTVRRKRK